MRILIACEESQAVCNEFRKRGHEAFSCDIQPCSGGQPEWHIEGDVLMAIDGWFDANEVINPNYAINLDVDHMELSECGKWAKQPGWKWDMMIAFPPCTHLALSGAQWFPEKRKDGRQKDGIDFFMAIYNAPIDKIAVENPMGIISGGQYIKDYYPDLCYKYGLPIKYTQIIQPYYFGDEAQKTTCLWLKNLPPLFHADKPDLFNNKVTHVGKGEFVTFESGKKHPKWYSELRGDGGGRSKTFPGIAKAMAEQWG